MNFLTLKIFTHKNFLKIKIFWVKKKFLEKREKVLGTSENFYLTQKIHFFCTSILLFYVIK